MSRNNFIFLFNMYYYLINPNCLCFLNEIVNECHDSVGSIYALYSGPWFKSCSRNWQGSVEFTVRP